MISQYERPIKFWYTVFSLFFIQKYVDSFSSTDCLTGDVLEHQRERKRPFLSYNKDPFSNIFATISSAFTVVIKISFLN